MALNLFSGFRFFDSFEQYENTFNILGLDPSVGTQTAVERDAKRSSGSGLSNLLRQLET